MALHRNSDENNKHNPKGFTNAPNMGKILRDETGESTYVPETTLPAVINFVDGNLAPPTEVLNDTYVIIDTGGGAVHADWDGVEYNDWTRYVNSIWVSYTPANGNIVYDKTAKIYNIYESPNWGALVLAANISNDNLTFDADHYVDLGAFSWTLNGTAPIGVDAMFSVQTNTEIKGLDDSSGTKVFHVINDSEESLLDIRGNGQTGINGLYGSGSALAVRNPNNEGQIAEFYNTDGSRSVIISANGAIQTFKSGTATTVFRARIFGSVPHLELFHPSLGQIVDLQSGASYISTTALTIGGTVSKVGAKFTLLQASTNTSQQKFFANITTTTTGRTNSSGSFGADQKGFECFDTDLNKKFVWNGSAWEQITSA